MNIKRPLLFLCTVLFWRCDSATDNGKFQVALQTDLDTYMVGDIIHLTLINELSDSLILDSCCDFPDFQYQYFVNGEWTPGGICEYYCASLLITLDSGEIRSDSLIVYQPGYQRILLRYILPETVENDSVVSNPFWVEEIER